jgi:hypothetical protein
VVNHENISQVTMLEDGGSKPEISKQAPEVPPYSTAMIGENNDKVLATLRKVLPPLHYNGLNKL